MEPERWQTSDDALMQALKEAVAAERAVPESLIQAAVQIYDLRDLDLELELLSLTFDSLAAEAAGLRAPRVVTPRMLVFDGEQLTIELEVGDDVLMGQVIPAAAGRVVMQCADGRVDEVDADECGFFLFGRPEQGPIRLTLREPAAVVTEWITL